DQRRGDKRGDDRGKDHASGLDRRTTTNGGLRVEERMATTVTPVEDDRRSPGGLIALVRRLLRMRETGLILIILTLFVVMTFASPYFLTWVNMRAMAMAFAVEGIVVV